MDRVPCDFFPNVRNGFNMQNLIVVTKEWFHYVKLETKEDRGNQTEATKEEILTRLQPDRIKLGWVDVFIIVKIIFLTNDTFIQRPSFVLNIIMSFYEECCLSDS